MGTSIASIESASLPERSANHAPVSRRQPGLFEPAGPPVPWSRTTYGALLALVALWGGQVYFTWAAWGNLSIDCGHEMYVPALLAQGKVLYRDVWFQFGPVAPYFNSYLFRIFGINLSVLYWAGALSVLGSAVFLYLAGMRLSSWLLGWTAGAVLVLEAFQPTLFCFPLPYSYSAVYGCLVGCLFVWLVINAATSPTWKWMFASGAAAALAMLLKPEYGTACYVTLAVLILGRFICNRNWASSFKDVIAILPGILLCASVILWMVSLRGVEFITQENIQSWPTSYFMKTYGRTWLAYTGFQMTGPAFYGAMIRALPVAAALAVALVWFRWRRSDPRAILLKAMLFLLIVLYFALPVYLSPAQAIETPLRTIFFPRDMVLYIAIATCFAGWACWRKKDSFAPRNMLIPLLLVFSTLLAFRILMKNTPWGYPIYYNGPVALAFLLLVSKIVPRRDRSRRFIFLGEAAICLACLTGVAIYPWQAESAGRDFVPLSTDRGTIRVSKQVAENYAAAIRFMKQKAALGESVMSIPEDTSLYFLSDTICPTRVFLFTPGVLAPGKMTDDTIHTIDEKRVPYLLWSNRTFPSYNVPMFGKDFDRPLGDYLESHYHLIGPVMPETGSSPEWTANVWERNSEAKPSRP